MEFHSPHENLYRIEQWYERQLHFVFLHKLILLFYFLTLYVKLLVMKIAISCYVLGARDNIQPTLCKQSEVLGRTAAVMIMCNTIFWVRTCWRLFGIQRGHTVLGICCQCSNMEWVSTENCEQDPAGPLLVLGYKFSERVTSREGRLQWVSIDAAALGTPVAKTVSLQALCRCWEGQEIGHVLFRCIPFLLLLPFFLIPCSCWRDQSHLRDVSVQKISLK